MTEMKRLVVIESPFKHDEPHIARAYVEYAGLLCRYAFSCGVIPFASHLIYTRMLDDSDPFERSLGIEAGLQLVGTFDESWFGVHYGESGGMSLGMAAALAAGRQTRTIDWDERQLMEATAANFRLLKATK